MSSLTPQDLHALLTALRRHFATIPTEDNAAAGEIRHVSALLDRLAGEPLPPQPTGHPLTRHLASVLDLAEISALDLATILRSVAGWLPWRYGYEARSDSPGLEGAMGWAEIVGPLAPFRSDEVCLGLTLIGPRTYYLPHRHPAVELYRVVAGNAAWTNGSSTRVQPPGAAILHTSNAVHAMRTGHEPLLAIYSWTGDVVSPSVWAAPAPATRP